MKRRTKSTLTKVIAIILGVALLGGCATLISNFANNKYEEVHPSYKIGSLNSEGGYVEDEGSMYSEHFECRGIKITPTFDSKVKYRVAFYEEDGTFVSMTTENAKKTQPEVPENAMYARVLITPKDDEDGKISIVEKFDYANDITIYVLKDGVELEYEYEPLALTDSKFVAEKGGSYSADGRFSTADPSYDSYTYTATETISFYVESSGLGNAHYVIMRADGTSVRYQMANDTWVEGEDNTFILNAGEKVHISIVGDASSLIFYEGKIAED